MTIHKPFFTAGIFLLCTWTLPAALNAADRLELLAPGTGEVSADGRKVRFQLTEEENLDFNIRGGSVTPPEKQENCPASLYLELGSRTFVDRSVEEEQERRRLRGEPPLGGPKLARLVKKLNSELRSRRAAMGYGDGAAYRAALSAEQKDDNEVPRAKRINCHLKLHAEDVIHTRLEWVGADSSNVNLECGCTEGPDGQCARIVNPFTLEEMDGMQDKDIMSGEPVMLNFAPGRCGLNRIDETGGFSDSMGAIAPSCDPVTGVRVSHCEIHGRISARSFSGDMALYSSPRHDHVKRLRESAAQHLRFDRLKIVGQYRTPIHLLPGVHHVTVTRSEIHGGQYYSTVYLPADGGFNSLVNNEIWGQSVTWDLDLEKPGGSRREAIAIDSSEHNRIINNRFHRMPYGGIFMFRNCGESSMLRHRPAQYNQVIDNVFDFGGRAPDHPAVFIGSRDEIPQGDYGVKKYCDHDLKPDNTAFSGNDEPFPWDLQVFDNSSEDNGDWAGRNVVAQNSFANYGSRDVWRPERFIRLSRQAERLANNYVAGNYVDTELARALDRQRTQLSGCATVFEKGAENFLFGARPFIPHGEPIDAWWSAQNPIRLTCEPARVCVEGLLLEGRKRSCRIRDFAGACSTQGDAAACSRVKPCPAGTTLVGVQAACNLEFGPVTDAQLDGVALNQVEVVRASDHTADGHCRVNDTDISSGLAMIPEWVENSLSFGCSESDRNDSGECQARIRMYCRDNASRASP